MQLLVRNLKVHMYKHSGEKPLECHVCGYRFAHTRSLQVHMHRHDPVRKVIGMCPTCGRSFNHKSAYKVHLRTAHSDLRPYACTQCSKTFKTNDLLKRHCLVHSNIRPHVCSYCGKAFARRNNMLMHTKIHTGETPHSCWVCGKGFLHKQGRDIHLKTHGKVDFSASYKLKKSLYMHEMEFNCLICERNLKGKCCLLRHIIEHTVTVRTKPRKHPTQYVCPFCLIQFKKKYNMDMHIRRHTGEKPFKCNLCDSKFTQGSGLKSHMLQHKPEPAQFSCNYCDRKFIRRTGLRDHLVTHTDVRQFNCSICSMPLKTKASKRVHERKHGCRDQLLCPYCDKGISTVDALRAHLRLHTGQKKYECVVCKKRYAQKHLLDSHLMIHVPYIEPTKSVLKNSRKGFI